MSKKNKDVKKEENKRKYNYDYIEKRNKNRVSIMKNLTLVSQLALIILTSIFVCLGIGYFLDKIIGTSLVFKIIFLIIGVIAGWTSVYKIIMKNIE